MRGKTRVPKWWVIGLGPEEIQAICKDFEERLAELPMSHQELASQLRVAHSTVGRWARGQTRPSLEDMIAAIDVISERLRELQTRVNWTARVLQAVQATQDAWGSGDLHEVTTAAMKVRKLLKKGSGR